MVSSIIIMLQTPYSISVPVFSGPLDLLLRLIEREELDITQVSLSQVTDQYLKKMTELRERRVEGLADFLVLAARLVLIKSQALLPKPPEIGITEIDPGEELAKQLRMYKKFKDMSEWLDSRQVQGLRTFLRIAAPVVVVKTVDLSGIELYDLRVAMADVLSRPIEKPRSVSDLVGRPRITVRGSINKIAASLRRRIRVSFFALLKRGNQNKTKTEIIATFLGILELARRNMVKAEQSEAFGDIEIVRLGDWDDSAIEAFSPELDGEDAD
ncbi:MAG: segregation/condensation protein A [Chloroflexi bacterium]|nr:segregation/condensation protein A [Chloroflexota bacterium]HCU81060.1 segregation/condensation protein A [Chloroflexota bacterium]